jgi:5-methylcytosine-specific restriction endonuclease McrA
MNNIDRCDYIISRPDCAAEIYCTNKVILYNPRTEGVNRNIKLNDETSSRIKDIEKELNIKINISPIGYRWSFTSSKPYALIRNRHLSQTKRPKHKCSKCNKIFHSREIAVHHIQERSDNGSDSTGNLMILCLYCHDIETWRLVTKNKSLEKIPITIIWKKLITRKLKLWKDLFKQKNHKIFREIERHQRSIIYFSSCINNPNSHLRKDLKNEKKIEAIKLFKEKIVAIKEEIKRLKGSIRKDSREYRKLRFWQKYDRKTKSWKTTIDIKHDISKSYKTLDKFI